MILLTSLAALSLGAAPVAPVQTRTSPEPVKVQMATPTGAVDAAVPSVPVLKAKPKAWFKPVTVKPVDKAPALAKLGPLR